MQINTVTQGEGSLRDKITEILVFIVLASNNYIEDLKNKDSQIIESLRICKELQKDTVVLIDKNVSGQDTDILKKYTLGLKIVREEVFDFKDLKTLARVFKEIEKAYDVGDVG